MRIREQFSGQSIARLDSSGMRAVCGVIDILIKTTSCWHLHRPLSRKTRVKTELFLLLLGFQLCVNLMAGSACLPARILQRFPRLRASTYARNGEEKGNKSCAKSRKFCVSGLGPMFAISCQCERLLKGCASRQEKTPCCNENSAASDTHIGHLGWFGFARRRFGSTPTAGREKDIAWPQYFDALAQVDCLVRGD